MGKFDQANHGEEIPVVAFADLPAAATANIGQILWCPTGIAGSAGLIVSNGTNWVHVADGTTTAAEA
jgi:hypothetical protein